MKVFIVEMVNGISMYRWACALCIDARRAAGWTVKVGGQVPGGTCADCELARQAAPEYRTPTVDYVKPDPDSRLPTPTEVARTAGVKPMPPHAKPKTTPHKRTEGRAA